MWQKREEITINTADKHYWNYKVDPNTFDATWGETIYTDCRNFDMEALKICVEIPKEELVQELLVRCPACDYTKFAGSNWYK